MDEHLKPIWGSNSPECLLTLCTQFCVKNLDIMCIYEPSSNLFRLREGLTLPNEICERLIEAYQELGTSVNDGFLSIFLNTHSTRLRRVNLSNSNVTDVGLNIVQQHNLLELDISGCDRLSPHALELINRNGSELLSLNVGTAVHIFPETAFESELTFMSEAAEPDIVPRLPLKGCILNTPHLRKLYLKYLCVPVEENYFEVLFKPLANLVVLDLTGCGYLGKLDYLLPMKHLYSLTLYDVHHLQDGISSICQLKLLRHLDISQHNDKYGIYHKPNQVLSQLAENLKHLSSLDISGTNLAGTGVAERELSDLAIDRKTHECSPRTDIPGLLCRVNNPLEFLGLFNTCHDACRRHHIPAKCITGDANEEQILRAANVYMDRLEIMKKVLNDLFHIVRYATCQKPAAATYVILIGMNKHLSDKHIQISGSASLFYIAKGEEMKHFSVKVKQKIIKTILDAMLEHKHDTTMIRNGCLTLCHFKIPQDVLFDYERLVKVLLYIVAEDDQEEFVQRIGIYLLNSLACQVDWNFKQLVGDLGAIDTMLTLIENRLSRKVCDDVMEIAWSTMWNVTDETPENCEKFLESFGMELFLGCLKAFPDKPELLRNMMGLLGNVAEVQYLRPRLMTEEFLNVFSDLLDSSSDGIEVSYNAAGVLSHIASDGHSAWNLAVFKPCRENLLRKMVNAIERWDINTKRNINYRSFEPILRLLKTYHTPEVQHWAVWALANLTRVYPEKYCPLIQQEKGIPMLQKLLLETSSYSRIKDLATLVIKQCDWYNSHGTLDDLEETGSLH